MSPGESNAVAGVIAIDGPAAGGKTTLARLLAEATGLAYLDTGAFYRAAALAVLREGVSCEHETAAAQVVERAAITQAEGRTRLDGEDVEEEIRTRAVTAASSRVATLPAVRRILVERQRKWVAERGGSAVVEGRDIGSVVFPDAAVKIFLTADGDERTRRRAGEMKIPGEADEVAESLARRDRRDVSRTVSPLRTMPDAMVIDTTSLGPEQVAAMVLEVMAAGGPVGSKGRS